MIALPAALDLGFSPNNTVLTGNFVDPLYVFHE
jgi:hypothetical protein